MKRIQDHELANDGELSHVRAALASQPDVAAAYLFGSLARGQATPRSDMDIAVLLGSPLAGEERGLGGFTESTQIFIQIDPPVSAKSAQSAFYFDQAV